MCSFEDEIRSVGLAMLRTALWVCHFLCQVDPLRTVYVGFACILRSAGISPRVYGFRRIGGGGDRLPKLKVAGSRPVARFLLESHPPLVATVLTEADLPTCEAEARGGPRRILPACRRPNHRPVRHRRICRPRILRRGIRPMPPSDLGASHDPSLQRSRFSA